jgi:hypothetical protein
MSYTRDELNKMFEELPDDVTEAMTSVETIDVLRAIKEKYKLHIDKAGDLSAAIAMVMLGAVPPQSFIANIQKALEVDKETAKTIATEINDKIFKQVRDSLMQIHQMDEEKKYQEEKKVEVILGTGIPAPAPVSENEETKKPVVDPYKEAV